MTGLQIAAILFGILCGNMGAVILSSLNLGLFWNSIFGGIGAAIVAFAPIYLAVDIFDTWYSFLLTSGVVGLCLMLVAGALVSVRYR